jgi:hypothetical protein
MVCTPKVTMTMRELDRLKCVQGQSVARINGSPLSYRTTPHKQQPASMLIAHCLRKPRPTLNHLLATPNDA